VLTAAAAAASFLLDLLLGDPAWMPHPVVYMGKVITWYERRLRGRFPETARGAFASGLILALALPLGTLGLSWGLIALLRRVHPALGFCLSVFWGWQALALRDMKKESSNVYRTLETGTLAEARQAVGRIVGRDTDRLEEPGVIRATVETVAESFSVGLIAPLCYLLLGGAPLALCYKAINTMDSMIGYRNERYLYFGRAAARLDDGANYIPARISALLLILAAGLCGLDPKGAMRIWRRDRRNHASPNSAQTESAMAGALGVQLGGPAWYFGELYRKPTIGDSIRPVERADILRANRMLYTGGVLGILLLGAVRVLMARIQF